MRWERLFEDLEARLDEQERASLEGDVIDLIRAERGQITLADRLRAHVGESLTWSLGVGAASTEESSLEGELIDIGADWALVRAGRGEMLLRLAALQSVVGLSRAVAPEPGEVARRLRITTILRRLAQDRATVSIRLATGERLEGTIDRVGADHLDLAVHPLDVARRPGRVIKVCSVLIQAIVSVSVT
jgi:hypothetical protein